MPGLRYLSEALAEGLVADLTRLTFPDSPAFRIRGEEGRAALLSALAQPHWPYYRTLPEKAGALHYSLNKNHPFADGNKRFALTAMEAFILMNRALFIASAAEAEAFSLGVAAGTIDRDESIAFVRRRTLRAGWGEARTRHWLERLPADEQATVEQEMQRPTNRLFLALAAERARAEP